MLRHEQIDAAGDKCLGLLAEIRFGLVGAHLAPRLDADIEWTDRTGDIGAARAPPCAQDGTFDLVSRTLSPSPNDRHLTRFAPKLLVANTCSIFRAQDANSELP
jgi:hypothetical protein